MRLLYLSGDPGIPVLGHKGASVHVRELTSALTRLGVEVAVASPRIEPMGDVLDAPVELVPIPAIPTKGSDAELRAAVETQTETVANVAGLFGADAIYERYSLFGAAGVAAAAALGIPHVLEVNAPLRDEARRFRTLPHPDLAAEIERTVFAGTDRILAVSAALQRWLEDEGVEPGRIEVVPNAVAPARVGERLSRLDADFVLGFCGSLKPWHGIEVLLEACAIAFAQAPTLRLEVVGSGPLEHLVESADLPADRLRCFGALPHAAALERLRHWDAGVAPYLPLDDFYFSPLKVLEYMAVGLCPVASDLGDVPELLGDGERGVLVPAGDAEELANAFVALARDRERAAELGRRAREHVLDTHTWEGNARIALAALRPTPRGIAA
ncbi:MAG: ATP-binding cassette, subfamily bacterial [Gaiellaceae bacterium]|jgi:glycosyltransferase involved in cell wall biosynthesis|nr:ATP-binding cassette, subfamily bacterial [Gaiellaceae bacterium]